MKNNRNRKSKRETLDARIKQRDSEYTDTQWNSLKRDLQKKLSRFYPNKTEMTHTTHEHSANEWANHLVDQACHAVSFTRWFRLRTPKEQLKRECLSLLLSLKDARTKLNQLSPDLRSLLGPNRRGRLVVDADILDCHNKIKELIPRIDAAGDAINRLPKVKKTLAVQREAAIEMAIVVLHELNKMGISLAASETSVAVKVLKIIGDCLDLELSLLTWRDIINKAKKAPQAIWRFTPAPSRASALLR